MRWNKAAKVERPEFPKLVPVSGEGEEVSKLLALVQSHDPDSILVDGGKRGAYLRVHNEAAEAAATGEKRDFPMSQSGSRAVIGRSRPN